MPKKVNGWDSVKELVLTRLDEMHKDIKEVRENDLPAMKIAISELKAKSSLWGALSGTIGGGLAILLAYLIKN
jgi:hypothetical protein